MNRKSFTIVEIMVVMAVIGIIMTLSIVGIQAAQKQQRVTTINNDMNQFKLAMASYYSDYRMYPIPGDSLAFDTAKNQICLFEPGSGPGITELCETVTNRVFKLDLSQPGMDPSTNGLDIPFLFRPCSLAEATATGQPDQNIVIPTAEKWFFDYRYQTGSRPQSYKIRFCDESGPTEFSSQ